ncbi:MAG: HigA family addiction module antidote protein [Nitrospirae bacterium]|nr:HigA family addiction module antidote protein [Nitrospirota bacterium]MBF0536353.1 HigA family addiction module antidote protein [Nitrospirota bacterium]MBF0616584.1 HigA family addiction module antidote protein [Nitrospirota bacterium]
MTVLKNIHPGEILKEEFLKPMGVSAYKLCKETGLTQTRLSQIIKGKRNITTETALKLGKYFNVPPEFWLNLQIMYDLEEAKKIYSKAVEAIIPCSV